MHAFGHSEGIALVLSHALKHSDRGADFDMAFPTAQVPTFTQLMSQIRQRTASPLAVAYSYFTARIGGTLLVEHLYFLTQLWKAAHDAMPAV